MFDQLTFREYKNLFSTAKQSKTKDKLIFQEIYSDVEDVLSETGFILEVFDCFEIDDYYYLVDLDIHDMDSGYNLYFPCDQIHGLMDCKEYIIDFIINEIK